MDEINWNLLFIYDETSPSCLRWREDRRSGKSYGRVHRKAGDVAGVYNEKNKYFCTTVLGKARRCHRIIYEMLSGKAIDKNKVIDHIDGDTKNNKFSNLREVSENINFRNAKMKSSNTSGVTGVSRQKGRPGQADLWCASCRDLSGKPQSKSFLISRYGEDEAFRLACECRKKMIADLNEQDAGYTERHGLVDG